MSNTHGVPDTLKEWQAMGYDLLPACLVGQSGLSAPGSGLTLPAVHVRAYATRGVDLVYIEQAPLSVTVPNVAGAHWLIAHADTHSAVAGWTRRAGSHLLTQQAATQPTIPDGAVLCAQLTVAGGNITAVDTSPALSPPLSRQTADAVAITGGSAVLDGGLTGVGLNLEVTAGAGRYSIASNGLAESYVQGPLQLNNTLISTSRTGLGAVPLANALLTLRYTRSAFHHGVVITPDADTAGPAALFFNNAAGSNVGSIQTTATATAYNTSSDTRLKEGIAALVGAIDVVRALRPVSFRWQADGSKGIGFLAHELMRVVPEAVTGEPDAVHDDGSVRPQQVDHSRLLPWAIAGMQALLAQVEALTARVQSLEEQLGI